MGLLFLFTATTLGIFASLAFEWSLKEEAVTKGQNKALLVIFGQNKCPPDTSTITLAAA